MVSTHASHHNTIPCHLCDKFLGSKYLLESHIKTVHEKANISRVLCGDCGKTFKKRRDLMRHVGRVHSDQRFDCKECGKKLVSAEYLLRHFQTYHTGREPMKCPQCEKTFYREINLQIHVRDGPDKLKPFYCDMCQFKCARLNNLNLHRKNTHNRPDKLTKSMLISMVENDQHPSYTRDDLPMISFVYS